MDWSKDMNVDLEGMITNACKTMSGDGKGIYTHGLLELLQHIAEVKHAHMQGRSAEILDEFFGCYKIEAMDPKEKYVESNNVTIYPKAKTTAWISPA